MNTSELTNAEYTEYHKAQFIEKFIESNSRYLFVNGIAGTGKTYMEHLFAEIAIDNKYIVSVSAPTNKAVSVIKNQENPKIRKAQTNHRLLHLRHLYDNEGDTQFKLDTIENMIQTVNNFSTNINKNTPKQIKQLLSTWMTMLDEFRDMGFQNLIHNKGIEYITDDIADMFGKKKVHNKKTNTWSFENKEKIQKKIKLDTIENEFKNIVVFIDEASMCEDLICQAFDILPIRLVIFGDLTQLKPVNNGDLCLFYRSYLHEKRLGIVNEINLDRNFRCKNPIHVRYINELSTCIRNGNTFDFNQLIHDPCITMEKYTLQNVIQKFNSLYNIKLSYNKDIDEEDDDDDDDDINEPNTMMLCYTNKMVKCLNNEYRKYIFGQNPNPMYNNELFVVQQPFYSFSSKILNEIYALKQTEIDYLIKSGAYRQKHETIGNNILDIILKKQFTIEQMIERSSHYHPIQSYIRLKNVLLTTYIDNYSEKEFLVYEASTRKYKFGEEYDYEIRLLHPNDRNRFMLTYNKLKNNLKTETDEIQLKIMNLKKSILSETNKNKRKTIQKEISENEKRITTLWKKYYEAKYKVCAPIVPAYAMTIHKSQGSSYNNVVLVNDFVHITKEDEYQRLFYVAISRINDKCHIFQCR